MSSSGIYQPKSLLDLCTNHIVNDPKFSYGPCLYEIKYEMPLNLFTSLLKKHVDTCHWVKYVFRTVRGGEGSYCDPCVQRNIQRRPNNIRSWQYKTRGPYFWKFKLDNLWCKSCGKKIANNSDHDSSLRERGLPSKIYVECRCFNEDYVRQLKNS